MIFEEYSNLPKPSLGGKLEIQITQQSSLYGQISVNQAVQQRALSDQALMQLYAAQKYSLLNSYSVDTPVKTPYEEALEELEREFPTDPEIVKLTNTKKDKHKHPIRDWLRERIEGRS